MYNRNRQTGSQTGQKIALKGKKLHCIKELRTVQ